MIVGCSIFVCMFLVHELEQLENRIEMKDDANIQPMQSDFEQIKKLTEDGKEYWSARELAETLGYSTWQKFNRVLNKSLIMHKVKAWIWLTILTKRLKWLN